MANSELANAIAQAVQESLEAFSSAMTTTEVLHALEMDEAVLESMTDKVYDSTTNTLDDIPATARRGHGLVVLRED